jgi:hypothetical protein
MIYNRGLTTNVSMVAHFGKRNARPSPYSRGGGLIGENCPWVVELDVYASMLSMKHIQPQYVISTVSSGSAWKPKKRPDENI